MMIPDNITLIVKAPNQQIDDQSIKCQSSWTVRELKGHLSEVYPSKPSTDEQKIIYSGQLLDDNTVLKDVLRTYESQIAHTMHLVCTPKREDMTEKGDKMLHTAESSTSEGLRLRTNVPASSTENNVPVDRQNDHNHSMEMQNYMSSFVNNYSRVPSYPNFGTGYLPVPNDPEAMANHMLMMQQAYVQYMQQYANMWQASGNNAVIGTTPPVNVATEVPPQQPVPDPPAAPQHEEPEEAAPRDWLDWVYAACRLGILFSLVYFYSSPFRFLLVVMLCAMAYLHQVGFFRDLAVNQQNEREPRREQLAPDQNRAANNIREPRAATEPINEVQNRDTDVATPSLLAVTWMIVTSFFTSLIPETN